MIKPVKNSHFSLSADSVEIFIPVEKFTEGEVQIPVSFLSEMNNIKLFPEIVTVTYIVALKDYQKVNKDLFIIQLIPGTQTNKNIELIHHPSFVKVIKIEPQHIDYIILK